MRLLPKNLLIHKDGKKLAAESMLCFVLGAKTAQCLCQQKLIT